MCCILMIIVIRKGDVMIIMTHPSCQDQHDPEGRAQSKWSVSGQNPCCKWSCHDQEGRAPSDGERLSARLSRRTRVLGPLRLAPRSFKIIFSKFNYLRLAPRSYTPIQDYIFKIKIPSCSSTQFPQSHAALTRCREPPGFSPLLTMGSIKRTR